MTPKEKAKELIHEYEKELLRKKYAISGYVLKDLAKECAKIAAETGRKAAEFDSQLTGGLSLSPLYWLEVKSEIEKL